MKQGIHPDYHPVVFQDASTGKTFLTRSTATSSRTIEWEDGNSYPLLVVDITADSHPFWTGTQRLVDTARPGREVQPPLRKARALMAVPKRRTSRSNTRHRRSQWKATAPDLVRVRTLDGKELLVPRRLVAAYKRGLI